MPFNVSALASQVRDKVASRLSPPEPAMQCFSTLGHATGPAASEPSPEVQEGVSRSRRFLQSFDGKLASGLWETQAGTFTFAFGFDEWVHILEGEVHVTAGGVTRTLQANDVAFFPAGLKMTWNVPKFVRKVWIHRYPREGLRGTARKLVRMATGG